MAVAQGPYRLASCLGGLSLSPWGGGSPAVWSPPRHPSPPPPAGPLSARVAVGSGRQKLPLGVSAAFLTAAVSGALPESPTGGTGVGESPSRLLSPQWYLWGWLDNDVETTTG